MKTHVGNIIIILLIVAAAVLCVMKIRSADALTVMPLDNSQWFLLIAGLVFTTFGGLVFFSNRFLSLMQGTLWRQRSKLDKAMFPDGAHLFNRYGRGLGPLILGVGLLLLFVRSL